MNAKLLISPLMIVLSACSDATHHATVGRDAAAGSSRADADARSASEPDVQVTDAAGNADAAVQDFQPKRSCESLSDLSLLNTTVVSAGIVEATDADPEYCNVQLIVSNATSKVNIRVGVFLPTSTWNGRFVGTGGGGMSAGDPSAPCGVLMGQRLSPCAISAGYANATTDGGVSAGANFPRNPDKTLNWPLIESFAHLGIHEMTTTAKAVIAEYYGAKLSYSYFVGGSQGGRQASMAAQRYPTDYDGIVSAEPAINFTKFTLAELWPQLVMNWANNFIPQPKFEAVNRAVVAACDTLDGVKDGIIADWENCRVSAQQLVGMDSPSGEITTTDADVISRIWEGPRDTQGGFLWYGLPPGTPFGGPTSQLGGIAGTTMRPDGSNAPAPFAIGVSLIASWVLGTSSFDWRKMTHDQFVQYFHQMTSDFGEVIASDDPNLVPFRDAGGKLLLWHGTNDELIFVQGSIDYYRRVVAAAGGLEETRKFARLFIAPGANHLGTWTGPAPTDATGAVPTAGSPLGALVEWVERGKAPDELLGVKVDDSKGTAQMTRPICLYPRVARFKGNGDVNDASSFACSDRF